MARTGSVTFKCMVYTVCVHFQKSVILIITLLNFIRKVQVATYYSCIVIILIFSVKLIKFQVQNRMKQIAREF